MHEVLKAIGDFGIIPVVVVEKAEDAVPLCKALACGGLPVAEITFRTAAAEDAIRNVATELPEILVGAGTVLTVEQARQAISAGAAFIVSPGFDSSVVSYCLEAGVPVTPGCGNPTDICAAVAMGLEVVKFFPAEALGGLELLKAISAPFGNMKFIPTGGVNTANLNDYLSFGNVLACGGTWIAKPDLISGGSFDEISKIACEAVAGMLGFSLAHVGINAANADESLAVAHALSKAFKQPLKDGNNSNFAGAGFEVMKSGGLGDRGHIAINTNSIARAAAFLRRSGIEIDWSTAKGPTGGSPTAVYLKDEIGGFAFHLLQRK